MKVKTAQDMLGVLWFLIMSISWIFVLLTFIGLCSANANACQQAWTYLPWALVGAMVLTFHFYLLSVAMPDENLPKK